MFASAYMAPAKEQDQVVAGFDRLLAHTPPTAASAPPAASKGVADPLAASVNAVLWERPSYHLQVKSALLWVKPKGNR
jgi:hypothetical protein